MIWFYTVYICVKNTCRLFYSAGKPRARAGEEPGDLGVLRTKLLRFLATSRHYVAAEHITSFPQDGEYQIRHAHACVITLTGT